MSLEQVIRINTRVKKFPSIVRILAVFLVVFFVAFIRWVLSEWLEEIPFLPFFPAVVICAFFFGTRLSCLASFLSFIAAYYLFIPPVLGFSIEIRAIIPSILFFLALVFTGWSVGTLTNLSVRLFAAEQAKTVLFNELNHRSKNNLQMISSLLSLEAARVGDLQAKRAFEEAINRIGVVGQIHTLLYQGEALDTVNARDFVTHLCQGLQKSFVGARPIAIRVQAEALQLALEKAIPLGIVVNEAVTNALIHAFKDGRLGKVDVVLQTGDGVVNVSITDDGVGLGPDPQTGLGTQLIRMMSTQIGGTAKILPGVEGGVRVVVTVPHP